MINIVILEGRLTDKPTSTPVPKGAGRKPSAVVKFTLANNQRWRDKANEQHEHVDFVDIEVWDTLGEACMKHLAKGRRVLVHARLRQDRWETDGEPRSRIVLRADRVEFLDQPKASAAVGEAA